MRGCWKHSCLRLRKHGPNCWRITYTEAGLPAPAAAYWQQAGERARAHSAYVEAAAHLTRGLEMLAMLPDTAERARRELMLHLDLGPALGVSKGSGSLEVEQVYTRARELCQHVEDPPQLCRALFGLGVFSIVRAQYQTASELGEQLLTLARRVHDPASILGAQRGLGGALFWRGELCQAQAHLEQVITHYHPRQHATASFFQGANIKVHCLSFMALLLAWRGFVDQALHTSQEACSLARQLSHPFSVAIALFFTAWLHSDRRDLRACQDRAEAVAALSVDQGFSSWFACGTMLRGWAPWTKP